MEPEVDDFVPPLPESHHRNLSGGAARAAVFGVSDGLVSNVAIVLGFAGASSNPGLVRLAGLVGLIGGSVSMAAGEYASMRVQTELLERELEMERVELQRSPEVERAELVQIYRARGLDRDTAETVATQLMRTPSAALETHAREELGIDPSQLGSPVGAAVSSFVSFTVGALVPIVPWFMAAGTAALATSVVLSALAALTVGAAVARFTGRASWRTAARQLLMAAVPAAITYALGSAAGISGLG